MDKAILKKATDALAARRKAETRLAKMEEKKDSVKVTVYERVRAEYVGKLEQAKKVLTELVPKIQARALELEKDREQLQAELERVAEARDELTLRHHIDEIGDGEFDKQLKGIDKRDETLKQELAVCDKEFEEVTAPFRGEAGFGAGQAGDQGAAATDVEDAKPAKAETAKTTDQAATGDQASGRQNSGTSPKPPKGAGEATPEAAPEAAPPAASTKAAPKEAPPRAEIEEALGDPFAEAAAPEVGSSDEAFFTNPILLVRAHGGEETSYLLDLGELTIGRGKENDIVIEDDGVVAKHAVVKFHQDHYVMSACRKDRPLSVNEQQAASHPLTDGDKVRFGKTEVVFRNVRFDV